jgi:hypothetical protein
MEKGQLICVLTRQEHRQLAGQDTFLLGATLKAPRYYLGRTGSLIEAWQSYMYRRSPGPDEKARKLEVKD